MFWCFIPKQHTKKELFREANLVPRTSPPVHFQPESIFYLRTEFAGESRSRYTSFLKLAFAIVYNFSE